MKSFSVANHGKKSLQLHAAGDKHKSRLPSDSQTKLVQLVSNRKENNDNEKEKDEQVSTTPYFIYLFSLYLTLTKYRKQKNICLQ